eukprot:TRINITY_DN8464_c0_g1_i1.p1 TRINITY_DN8464_c0_g1~~TRINITY_DN8464_c0_g1_i1.p1  ORF type:complete len:320 (+),score=23.92 TRINITY_DN8464_c0_g1_i1:96-962(+)
MDVPRDTLYIDLNNVLHLCERKTNNKSFFWKILEQRLDRIVSFFAPKKSLYFAFDGPGPINRILKQRKRRDEKIRNHVILDGMLTHPRFVTGIHVTAGVPFMNEAKEFVCHYAADKARAGLDCIVSGPDRQGEGEYKIFQHISKNEGTSMIFTSDSDMWLWALQSPKTSQIELVNLDEANQPEISTPGPAKKLIAELANLPEEIGDFILLLVLAGSDYLPSMFKNRPLLGNWRHYLQWRQKKPPGTLIYDNETCSIDSALFADFLRSIVPQEPEIDISTQEQVENYIQ